MTITWGSVVPLLGGLSVGNKQAVGRDPDFLLSYTPFAGNDAHLRNYLKNVPYHVLNEDNLGGFDLDKYRGNVDFVSALCPCAGLSRLSSGSSEQRAGMNSWMIKSAEFITGELKPRVFWGENAPGLFTKSGEHVRNQLREIGAKNGYSFSVYLTNTMFHGIPQNRKRTFYFYWRGDDVPLFDYYDRPRKSLRDYMTVPTGVDRQLPTDIARATELLDANPIFKFLKAKYGTSGVTMVREHVKQHDMSGTTAWSYLIDSGQLPEARDYFKSTGHWREERDANRILKKLADKKGFWDGSVPVYDSSKTFATLICRTLTAVHPTEDRQLTVRECMHLMGLPHDFELVGDNTNHICQNVPVCTAKDMTEQVLKYLNGELSSTGMTYLMQNNYKKTVQFQESKLLKY